MLSFPLPPAITKDGELIIDPGDVDGEYRWIIILDHELLGAVDFDLCALRELRDLIDREIAIRTGEIPNTNQLCASITNVAGWWQGEDHGQS